MGKTKTVIIPIFIAHNGCPNDCSFCNQKKISGSEGKFQPSEMTGLVNEYLETIPVGHIIEIAFFGGSFTGIPEATQEAFLAIAKDFKARGKVHKIRLSTRPDYISEAILERLKAYEVDLVELGCQSFSDEVLKNNNRGHDASAIFKAVSLLKTYEIPFGIQLMLGLPGDSKDRFKESVVKTEALKPNVVRLYPTLVVADTALEGLYCQGVYRPLSLEEAIEWSAYAYNRLTFSNIKVIRMGLQKTDDIELGKGVIDGPFHPAFGELVLGRLYQWAILALDSEFDLKGQTLYVHPKCLSWVKGHKKHWDAAFTDLMNHKSIDIVASDSLLPFFVGFMEKNTMKHLSVLSETRGNHVFKKN